MKDIARHRIALLATGSVVCVLAVTLLAGSVWAFSKDKFGRDADGFLSIATTNQLQTGTYALVSELHGDGPGWLYGSSVMGDARARATPQNGRPLFMGIAHTADVSAYLTGVGYATIDHIATDAVTTHAGGAPSTPPTRTSIWVTSTQGTGEQTLQWHPRDGSWSIVVMNVDATAGVAVSGDVSAKAPILPWLALGSLLAGVVLAGLGAWPLVRGIRAAAQPAGAVGSRPDVAVPAGTHVAGTAQEVRR